MNKYISTGIVTTPVDLLAVAELLRRDHDNINAIVSNKLIASSDVCTHDNINMLSYHKPTEYSVPFPQTETQKNEQPIGVPTNSAGFLYGYNCMGISKPYITINVMEWNGENTPLNRGINNAIITTPWTLNKPSVRRLFDFIHYKHINDIYPSTTTKIPYSVNVTCYQREKEVVSVNCTMRMEYEDIVTGEAIQMGMKTLLGDTNIHAFIAVMLYFPVNVNVNPNRTTPVLFIAKGDQLGETSSLTGHLETVAAMADFNIHDTGIIPGETAYAIPVIIKSSANTHYITNLALDMPVNTQYTILSAGINANILVIKSIDINFTVQRDYNSYKIYLNAADDFVITTDGVDATLGSILRTVVTAAVMPADGTSNVQKINEATLSTYNEDAGAYETRIYKNTNNAYLLYTKDGTNFSLSTPPENRPLSLVISNSSSSFKIKASFPYYKNLQNPVYLEGTFTVNTADFNGNVSTKTYSITLKE